MKESSITPSQNAEGKAVRILILDRFYFPDEQATSVYLTELTEALAEKFDFEILCGPPLTVTENKASNARIRQVYQAPCLKLPKRFLFARAINDLSFLFTSLVRGLFLKKPDIVVSQTSPPGIWWVGFLLSRLHGARWIYVCQDIFPDNLISLNGIKSRKWISLLNCANLFCLKKADRIVVVGEDMKKKILEKGLPPEKISHIPNWADLGFIRPLPKKNSFTEKYRLLGKFVVLYAGNLGRTHNFEDIFGAAEHLRKYPQIVFILVGEGALKKKLLQECQYRELTNIRLVPFEPRSKLPEVLASADVSLVLLRRGMAGLSVPSKIYSILASGRPVIACVEEESEISSIVCLADSGFVIPPGNSEELARTIKELWEQPELKHQLGLNARRFAEERDFKTSALQVYEQTLREVIDDKIEATV